LLKFIWKHKTICAFYHVIKNAWKKQSGSSMNLHWRILPSLQAVKFAAFDQTNRGVQGSCSVALMGLPSQRNEECVVDTCKNLRRLGFVATHPTSIYRCDLMRRYLRANYVRGISRASTRATWPWRVIIIPFYEQYPDVTRLIKSCSSYNSFSTKYIAESLTKPNPTY